MSMELMVKAMKIRVGNPLRKLVLIKLADNASDQGECWPSYQHIADQCEISKRSVMNHIAALCESGLVKKVTRKGEKGNSSNIYLLHLDGAGDSLGGSANNSLSGAANSPGSAGVSPGGSAGDSPRTSHSFEPVKEPVNEPIAVGASVDESVRVRSNRPEYSPEFEQAWLAYPKRAGGNSKSAAFKAWKARLNEGVNPETMLEGVKRYAGWVSAMGNSAQAAADSQTASANSATAAKKSETNAKNSEAAAKSSETNAKASETNAKSSETNAAKSAADALNYRNQAQVIVGDNIGLGSAPRDCPDISGNPSGYIGFMRIMSNAKGFPSIASGESSLTGFISQVDGTPAYTGVFQGWATRSLYTYRWNPTIGPQWTRHARKNEVDRLDQWNSETWLYNHDKSMRLGLTGSTWGCYSDTQKKWIPLDVSHGGTGAATIDGARTNLGLGRNNSPQLNSLFLDRYSDSTSTYTSSGILHTRLLATDSTVRLGADMYVETLSNEPGQLTIRFTYDGSTGASKYLNLNSEGNLIVDSAILKSTVEKPLQIRSANPAIRFNETDRPANTPTYTLIANAGDWFIQKRDYDDAGSVSNAIAYNFANDRIDVQNLKASGLITANSGIATLTGHDWNAQHTDNVDKFRPIAGSTNGPAGSMVLGGIHVQFSKNYAVQFGGRNSGFGEEQLKMERRRNGRNY